MSEGMRGQRVGGRVEERVEEVKGRGEILGAPIAARNGPVSSPSF